MQSSIRSSGPPVLLLLLPLVAMLLTACVTHSCLVQPAAAYDQDIITMGHELLDELPAQEVWGGSAARVPSSGNDEDSGDSGSLNNSPPSNNAIRDATLQKQHGRKKRKRITNNQNGGLGTKRKRVTLFDEPLVGDDELSRHSNGVSEAFFVAPIHRKKRRSPSYYAPHRRNMAGQETTATAPLTCSSVCEEHGRCLNGRCICNKDPDNGFWAGDNCDDCDHGWAGPQCTVECAGGSCNACNGHGTCQMGITGDGTCICYRSDIQGYWDGLDCNKCANKYFGVGTCQLSCPGLAEEDGGLECYGRGSCIADLDGTGKCECDGGWGDETGCQDCDTAHYGFDCSGVCQGFNGQLPCSGHGRCFNGTSGNGTCVCDEGYGTADCSRSCPNDCSGRGLCLDGASRNAVCDCSVAGNWAPPDCSTCIPSKTGVDCNIDCRRDPTTGKICSGAGNCTHKNGVAVCSCVGGYLGDTCEISCPGTPPCSGHGTCGPTTEGTLGCICDADPINGYWTGALCDQCQLAYNNSANCSVACPQSSSGICSGHGFCANGECYCVRNDPVTSRDYCGDACEIQSLYTNQHTGSCEACGCIYCPELRRFGENCNEDCPGRGIDFQTGRIYACTGHGYCDEGKSGDGKCYCTHGTTGSACTLSCPRDPDTNLPCSGEARGICSYTTSEQQVESAVCKCYPEYGGTACEKVCPLIAGEVCSGNGLCNPLTAKCECSGPWTGKACNVPCACDLVNGRCDANVCYDNLSTETCTACQCFGNFTGLCDQCLPKHQGYKCDGECIHGTTVGLTCDCFLNYSTPTCGVKCPNTTEGVVCGGHGQCMWGALQSGKCQCQEEWFGPACTEWCTKDHCRATFGLINPQCNPDNGECECLDDNSGRWERGPSGRCDICKTGSWGPSCTEKCECSDHGSCDKNTGSCSCYQSDVDGYWTGTNCERCASGFIGENCERIEVLFTRIPRPVDDDAEVYATDSISSASIGPNQELFAGGSPTNVYRIQNAESIDLLNTTRNRNSIFSCGNISAEVAHVTSTVSNTFFVMQSAPACGLPIRILRVDLDNRNEWQVLQIISLPATLNTTVRVFAASSQVDTGEHSVIPPQMVVLHVAEPEPGTNNPYLPGTIIRVSLDQLDNFASFTPPSNFHAHDIAISPFAAGQVQTYAIAGSLITEDGNKWDALLLKEDGRFPGLMLPVLGDDQYSLRDRTKCWPATAENECSRIDCVCDTCLKSAMVQFSRSTILLAQVVDRAKDGTLQTMLARLSIIQNMAPGTQLMADVQSRCQLATVSEHPIGVTLTDQYGRTSVLEACSAIPCEQAVYGVQISIANQVGLIPIAKAFDSSADILYLALRHQVPSNKASALTKFDVNATRFGIYGIFDLVTPVEALAINKNQRMLYAVSKDLVTPVQSFLLYEVRQLTPDIADLRGGTKIALQGSGFKPPAGSKIVCVFHDTSGTNITLVEALSYDFWEVVCAAPRMTIESVTGTASSCEGQQVEVTIFGDRWFTANKRTVKRVQRPFLDPIVSPTRGFKDTPQLVQVSGSGFVPSQHSRCKFYSPNSNEVLFSNVIYLSPSEVNCTQGTAQFASTSPSYLDISLDGQLYSVDTPPAYEIVGDPEQITTQEPLMPKEALPMTNISVQIWVIDSQKHRLEQLDNHSRPVTLSGSVIETPCDEQGFLAWRRPDDGYPWPPCRNLTLNNTGWHEIKRQQEEAKQDASMMNVTNATTPELADALTSPTETPTPPMPSSLSNASVRVFHEQQNVPGEDDQAGAPLPNEEYLKYTTPGTGQVTFDEFYFYQPRAGTATLSFVGQSATWSTEMKIQISSGAPHALMIYNLNDFDENKFFVVKDSPLKAIELLIVDQLGNIVEDPNFVKFLSVDITAQYELDDGNGRIDDKNFLTKSGRKEGSRIMFDAIYLDHLHERSYYITFATINNQLLPVTTPIIRTVGCSPNEYKRNVLDGAGNWEGQCEACPPEGAVCNGTEQIIVLPGYWRSSNSSTDIYECKGGDAVCLGSGAAPNGSECATGHQGPMCSLCSPGFGRSGATSCTKCDNENMTIIYVTLIALAMLIGVLTWIIMTLRKAEVTDVSIIFRTVVNHMQAAGELGEFSNQWSPFLKTLFSVQKGGSSFSVSGVQSLDCMLKHTNSDYSSVFYGYMNLPPIACGLGVFVFLIVRVARLKPVITTDLRDEIERDIETFGPRARTAIILRRYPVYMVIITSLCVTMFTLYQTLITQSTSVLKCRGITVGYEEHDDAMPTPIIKNYMEADMSFSCDSDDYLSLKKAAWFFTAFYGFGIPLLFVCGYRLVTARIAKPELTKLMFTFLIGGYKEHLWFWQAVIMLRKMVLVCVIVFIGENKSLQSYCAVWTMSAALVLQIWFNPNEKPEHNMVEALSLALITITLNLSLLYFWPDMPDTGHFFLTGTLILMTLGAMVMFAYFLYQPLKDNIAEVLGTVKEKLKEKSQQKKADTDEEGKKTKLVLPSIYRDEDDDYYVPPTEIGVDIRNTPGLTAGAKQQASFFSKKRGGNTGTLAIADEADFIEVDEEPIQPRRGVASIREHDEEMISTHTAAHEDQQHGDDAAASNNSRGDGFFSTSPPRRPIAQDDSRRDYLANRHSDSDMTPRAFEDVL